MPTQSQADAVLFGAIHGLRAEQAVGQSAPIVNSFERRTTNRRPFACAQMIAPYDGQNLPAQAAFELVDCHDLSPSGFSFLCDEPPTGKLLVVALGTVPFSFVSAEVVRIDPVAEVSRGAFRVGCRFLQKLAGQLSSGGVPQNNPY